MVEKARLALLPLLLGPLPRPPRLGGLAVLAVVEDVAHHHEVGVVGEALLVELRGLVDRVHAGQGELHHLPGLVAARRESCRSSRCA